MHLHQLRLANWCMCICTLVLMSFEVDRPVGLEYRCICISKYRYIGVGTPVHLALSLFWIPCTACYNNIVQLGCRLIA